ncbi:MAG: glycosyltransferase [Deltaproteobacteria bacterium]|nr:glycosyltransferase [Deltaproteobacteria bacterium]
MGSNRDSRRLARIFQEGSGPDVALITNHGYAGAEVPVGGAPDTGGPSMYVKTLALSLAGMGHRVSIFARGGFPHFDGQRLRDEPEYLSESVRFVFVPGGGDAFIRKEDMAVALDEQLDWLDAFIRAEAEAKGCKPWEVFQLVNTHYWDAAVLGMGLVERWRNDLAWHVISRLLEGVALSETLADLWRDRHRLALGQAPVFHLGRLLLDCEGSPATPVEQRVRASVARWAAVRKMGGQASSMPVEAVEDALKKIRNRMAPALHPMVAADALGVAILTLSPGQAEHLRTGLEHLDRHVWTPHSLGVLDDEGQRNQPAELRRNLKFCDRRDHERAICDRTNAFAATSPAVAEGLRSHHGVPVDQIFYFPPCVDGALFRPYLEEETQASYEFLSAMSGLSVEQLQEGVILFETSRMDRTKRKDLLIDAFASIVEDCSDCYLFIGGGPANEVYKDLRHQLEQNPALAGRAFLTGYIPDEYIGPFFSMADIYLSASELEDFGMGVSQAAAAETAIICSDLVPFAVQYAAGDALVVHAGDLEDFAGAMRRLVKDPSDRQARAQRLAKKVKVLDWRAQTHAFLDFLRRSGMAIE